MNFPGGVVIFCKHQYNISIITHWTKNHGSWPQLPVTHRIKTFVLATDDPDSSYRQCMHATIRSTAAVRPGP